MTSTKRSYEVDELLDEILTDAKGDEEQLWALRQALEDNVAVPCDATLAGDPVKVTKFDYWRVWRKDGTWERAHDTLRAEVRQAMGKNAQPSAGIVDSQSVKTTDRGGVHGYDAGKKINGRKRHVLVDTLGLVWLVVVTAASTQDRDGARTLLAVLATRMRRLRLIWADGGYAGALVGWVASLRKWGKVRLELVARNPQGKGFQRLPHRWIVERTFGWLNRWRRLSKDYEHLTDTSECTIRVAMIYLMVRRLAPPKKRPRERRSQTRRLI